MFTHKTLAYDNAEIKDWFVESSRRLIHHTSLALMVGDLLELYPEDPSAGSPFGTGNQTFGLPAGYKRFAAICGRNDYIFRVYFH